MRKRVRFFSPLLDASDAAGSSDAAASSDVAGPPVTIRQRVRGTRAPLQVGITHEPREVAGPPAWARPHRTPTQPQPMHAAYACPACIASLGDRNPCLCVQLPSQPRLCEPTACQACHACLTNLILASPSARSEPLNLQARTRTLDQILDPNLILTLQSNPTR